MMWQSSLPAALRDRQEVVRRGRGLDRIHGDLHVAIGAVLESDRAREARGELAMHLAFRGARTDGAPGDQVGDVLRRDHVEVLGACGQLEVGDLGEDPACESQAFVDAEAVVEARVVDESLPAYGRARLLEVDAHHHHQIGLELTLQCSETRGVIDCGVVVVDRAGPHHDEQAVVRAVQDAMDGLARAEGRRDRAVRCGKFAQKVCRRGELGDVLDAGVVDAQPGTASGGQDHARAIGGGCGHGSSG
jgi:hypothetical protein